ncbi:secretory subunit [Ascosphaera acerosa]|nr:secretory subunit [Ascosphaera acerosa]
MSSTDYNYDEQGQFFPFFVATISGLVTLPLLVNLLRPTKATPPPHRLDLENTAPRISSDFTPEHDDLIKRRKQAQVRKQRPLKRIAAVVVGLCVMAYMVYLIIVTQRSAPRLYDPYEILGLSRSADEKAISRHYKRLSMIYHPDKIRPDPAKNETVESLNDHFIELTKAYKALTDEEVRNNYLQYGHPDGKQSYSIGIALPKFIVTEGNGKYVLLVYGALLGVLLPYIVGRWWYGSQKYTREKVLNETAGNLVREYKDGMNENAIVGALSSAAEFNDLLAGGNSHKAEHGLSVVEKEVFELLKPREKELLNKQEEPVRRKALALLWAYLARVHFSHDADRVLEAEKIAVGPTALALMDSMNAIALAFGNLGPLLASYRVSQSLIQALLPGPAGSSPLLQLPHFTNEVAEALEGSRTPRKHMTVQQFMALSDSERRAKVVRQGLLTEAQYLSAVRVAKQIPALQVCKAFFKVVGEKVVSPSSLVQFVVKARFVPPGSENVPDVRPEELEDIDPDEDDVDAYLGRKKNAAGTSQAAAGDSSKPEPVQPPLAHAPYLAYDHSPRWHLFLADTNNQKMAVPPFIFTTFDKPIFDRETGKPTFAVQTLKMQFQAPPNTGKYTFWAHLVCDSYVGFDHAMEAELTIEEPVQVVNNDDEISEPDEDTIAGQMEMLRTGKAPRPKSKAKAAADDAESSEEDDESDTEGEADDTSDTDTETEAED